MQGRTMRYEIERIIGPHGQPWWLVWDRTDKNPRKHRVRARYERQEDAEAHLSRLNPPS